MLHMKVTVIGSGGWGTALSMTLCQNGHDVTLWSHRQETTDIMEKTGECPRLKGISLPKELRFTSSLEGLGDSDMVVFVTPSFALRDTARLAAPFIKDSTILVTATKGIETESGKRMSEILTEETENRCKVVALSGPSHAEEVGRNMPTGVVVAGLDRIATETVQDTFMSRALRVYTNPDIVGVELGGALKNIIALCCGICDGMGLGDNTKALLMTRAMTEMARLGVAMGGRSDTFAGLSGMGDLIVTCTSMHSRNRRAGILIGQGKTATEAMDEVGAVVEGYYAAKSAYLLAYHMRVEMPICECAYEVLHRGRSAHEVIDNLMARSKKRETDKSWI